MRHELLHEGRVGLVDKALAFRRDGAEYKRGLARTRDAGEDRDLALGDVERDVLEIVLARTAIAAYLTGPASDVVPPVEISTGQARISARPDAPQSTAGRRRQAE
jgi:hypothetical protein